MFKPWLLRLHRWLTLVFAVPLALVMVTGLILSFEPVAQVSSLKPGSVTTEQVLSLLQRYDPAGQARSLTLRSYEDRLAIGGARPGDTVELDLRTGEPLAQKGIASTIFLVSRFIHEHLVPGFGWLVQLTTIALIVLIGLGIAMGWPRLSNTVAGWHKLVAWIGLPLLILSPLTGLFLAWGISFTGRPPPPPPVIPLVEAVAAVGAAHDLSNLVWLRSRGGRLLARVIVNGEYQILSVSRDGVTPTPRNVVRIFHEGNFAGIWSGLMNAGISLAFIGLMTTGLIIWMRRRRRPRRSGALRAAREAA